MLKKLFGLAASRDSRYLYDLLFFIAAKHVTLNKFTQLRVQPFHPKERTMLAWFETFAAPDVLVDIGANDRMHSIQAFETKCRIWASFFEPNSQIYALLNQNTFINGLYMR